MGWSEEREEDELLGPAMGSSGGQVGVRGTVVKKRRGRQVKRVWRKKEGTTRRRRARKGGTRE